MVLLTGICLISPKDIYKIAIPADDLKGEVVEVFCAWSLALYLILQSWLYWAEAILNNLPHALCIHTVGLNNKQIDSDSYKKNSIQWIDFQSEDNKELPNNGKGNLTLLLPLVVLRKTVRRTL